MKSYQKIVKEADFLKEYIFDLRLSKIVNGFKYEVYFAPQYKKDLQGPLQRYAIIKHEFFPSTNEWVAVDSFFNMFVESAEEALDFYIGADPLLVFSKKT